MRFINEELLKNKVIREAKGIYYYFDQEGIYRGIPRERLVEECEDEDEGLMICIGLGRYCQAGIRAENATLVKKAIAKLKCGDRIEELDRYLSSVVLETHAKPEGLDRFIARIGQPQFRRVPENFNKKTFDFIFVEVGIIAEWHEDRMTYIQKNQKAILEKVIEKIESNQRFKKYGVPINYLKMSRITLKRDGILEFVLELKKF